MPKKYKIQFMPLAIEDISEITDYIANVLGAPQACRNYWDSSAV